MKQIRDKVGASTSIVTAWSPVVASRCPTDPSRSPRRALPPRSAVWPNLPSTSSTRGSAPWRWRRPGSIGARSITPSRGSSTSCGSATRSTSRTSRAARATSPTRSGWPTSPPTAWCGPPWSLRPRSAAPRPHQVSQDPDRHPIPRDPASGEDPPRRRHQAHLSGFTRVVPVLSSDDRGPHRRPARPATLAEMAKGRMRKKIEPLRLALEGNFGPHHAMVCRQIIEHLDFWTARSHG